LEFILQHEAIFHNFTPYFYFRNVSIHFKEGVLHVAHHFHYKKANQTFSSMSNLLYIIAVILIIGWLLGAFVYSAGQLIHLLLVLAVISILLQLIRGRKS
jgi:uncharacterized membrane protein YkgB